MKQVPCQRAAGRDKGLAAVHDGQVIDEDDVTLRKKKKISGNQLFLESATDLVPFEGNAGFIERA